MKQQAATADCLEVLDLFCGAGGFSEGFRLAGCRIVCGVDHWKPAMDTFNCNFGLQGQPTNILKFERNVQAIEQLPDTDIIIGSPPCVSFSYSNKLGNADKTEGLRLIRAFFSVIAVKKFKPKSRLVAWYMENVPNAIKWLPESYTFANLGLSEWARIHGLSAKSVAVSIRDSAAAVLNAADFGVAQTRKRFFVGEIIKKTARHRGFRVTDLAPLTKTQRAITSAEVRSLLPSPTCKISSRVVHDPLSKGIRIPLRQLSDQFYESGLYEILWRDSKSLKTNHPYMGNMAFPENEKKPSRTILANTVPKSREALIYKSEWNRIGDGEFRGPTIREAATLMSFPITYQFVGAEGTKWRLVGNAVCPRVSNALAIQLLKTLGVKYRRHLRTELPRNMKHIPNLNTFAPKSYDKQPTRKKLARFRNHPLKAASMTVALTNYDISKRGQSADGRWRCFITYGTGDGFKVQPVRAGQLESIRHAIERVTPNGKTFIEQITNGFSEKIPSAPLLQELFENNLENQSGKLNPNGLLEEARKIILQFAEGAACNRSEIGIFLRNSVPVCQLYALFAVCHIASTAEAMRG